MRQVEFVKISFPSCYVEAFDPRDKSAAIVAIDNCTPHDPSLSKHSVGRHSAVLYIEKSVAERCRSSLESPVNPVE